MILYFNPGHETAVHNASPYYTAPANIARMQQELAYLPAWYGLKNDVVLVFDSSNQDFFNYISDNLEYIPKPITQGELGDFSGSEISLWGISPQAIYVFDELKKGFNVELDYPEWRDEFKYLNSRLSAKDCLEKLIKNTQGISSNITPCFCDNLADIEAIVNESDARYLAKAPYSSSGRGLLWLPVTGLTRTERQILHGILKKQGSVSIERVLDKQTDFAMEFICDGMGGISFEGYSLFKTNGKGAYSGNYIGGQDCIKNYLTGYLPPSLLEEVKNTLSEILRDRYASLYKGCIGVDMLIYRENDKSLLHPCLEINMRYNMGYLALKLYENHIQPSSHGQFNLAFSAIEGHILSQHRQMQQSHPSLFEDKRLKRGYLPLCPVNENSKYWAYILIED